MDTTAPARTEATANRRLELDGILADMVQDGLASREQAQELLSKQVSRRAPIHPLVLIADQKWPDPRNPKKLLHLELLTEWLAGRVDLPYLHIDPFKIDFAAVTKVMSNAYATRFRILPVQVTSKECVIAVSEPHVREWEAELARVLRLDIKRVLANPRDIDNYLVEFYNLARSVHGAQQQKKGELNDITNFEQLVQLGSRGQVDANDRHVVHIVDWIFQYAFEQRASDIHMEPRRDVGNVRFRIDGVLHQVYQIPTAVMAAMTSRIKILGRMDVVEKRRPQDGRIKTVTPDGSEVELRLSTMPTAFGEKLVMRIFNPDVIVKDYRELGFSEDDQNRWTQMTTQPHGIVLVTGPTGSGKTTTLYSTLKQLSTPDVNVCTIEDPIEMVEPSFNQMQVQHSIGLDFASGVRTLLRQDPDIIMVGEIRDLETAEMAIQASLTGHLVLSTLHTNDAPAAITRLLDIGVPPYLLHSTILGVMAQRLVRTLCPHCREAGPIDDDTWNMLITPWKAEKPKQVFHPKGCLECRMTGYMGRVGIYEIMLFTPGQRKFVTAAADLPAIREQAYRDGMRPLRISGAMKVAQGVTTVEEVLKSAPPITLDRRRKGSAPDGPAA
ncbi:MAG: Flp pilus assembly complex ATPase component TadA [Betaproteobacteria bacterium]|nr:Flp pilus assembly complex ATPase component TadA [Betaproteobacteria bacterium]